MNSDKINISTTTDGQPPRPGFETAGAPAPINPATGQHGAYWVLSPEERAKGFVRPVRRSYKHVGIPGPQHPLRDLGDDEQDRAERFGYVKFEAYPPSEETGIVGRYWTQADFDKIGKGCGAVTTMGIALAETYARNPNYYGATFCCNCQKHLPVGEQGEFIWVDGGQDKQERVGT